MTQIATLVFVAGICGLFLLNRDSKVQTSKALWLPVLWLLIAGSKPVSQWLNIKQQGSVADQYMDGSPLDRNIFVGLLILGLIVLFGRRIAVARLLRANVWIVVFLSYCALSIVWSEYPGVAFKRWIKFLGDFVMVLIVLTDADRLAALKRVLARVGFVLLPLSVLFIKYYPDLGRSYAAHWEGTAFYVGVAEDKNMLGMACLVFGLGSAWVFFQELTVPRVGRRISQLIVHGTMVAMTFWLLVKCNSMTSLSLFVLASGLVAVTSLFKTAKRRFVVQVLVVGIVVACFVPLFLGLGGDVLNSVGRDSTLTGRTALWDTLLGMDTNPVLGTGFESFWLGERMKSVWDLYWWHPTESHNGYLEIYLNLGWSGLAVLAAMMVAGYRNVIRLFTRNPEIGRLGLAFFVVGVVYNFTEAAIHTVSIVWFAFMMVITAVPEAAQALDTSPVLRRTGGILRRSPMIRTPEKISALNTATTARRN